MQRLAHVFGHLLWWKGALFFRIIRVTVDHIFYICSLFRHFASQATRICSKEALYILLKPILWRPSDRNQLQIKQRYCPLQPTLLYWRKGGGGDASVLWPETAKQSVKSDIYRCSYNFCKGCHCQISVKRNQVFLAKPPKSCATVRRPFLGFL